MNLEEARAWGLPRRRSKYRDIVSIAAPNFLREQEVVE